MLVNEVPTQVLVTHDQGIELEKPKKCNVLFLDKIVQYDSENNPSDVFVIVVYDNKKRLRPLLLSDCKILKTRRYGNVNFGSGSNTGRNRGGKRSEKRIGDNSSTGSDNESAEMQGSEDRTGNE